MAKKKGKKSQAESVNKTRIIMRLKKLNCFDESSAMSLRELGFTDRKKYEKHLEVLEDEGKLKKSKISGNYKYWVKREKRNKKNNNITQQFIIWIAASFVIVLFILSLF